MGKYNVHAGHCPQGKGACGAVGILKESVENRIVKNYLISYLKAAGHTVYDCTDDSYTTARQNLYNIVAKCNVHKVDVDISIHLDAGRSDYKGDGSTGGCTVLTTGNHSTIDAIAARIAKEISTALNIRNRGVVQRNDLYVLNHTNSPALLIECCFVDDKDDAGKWSPDKCAKAIFSGLTGAAVAGWVKDSIGWWYRYADGSYPKAQWLKLDAWYYFNAKGYALSSQWIFYKKKWYWLKSDCRMATGWVKVDGYWYYLDPSGAMMDGWITYKGDKYYLDPDGSDRPHGAMLENCKIEIDGKEYHFDAGGKLIK